MSPLVLDRRYEILSSAPMPTLSQLLAGETPDSTKSFGDYFDYINKSLAIIQKVKVDPLCGWKKIDDDEYELVPPNESIDSASWQAKVRDALRMAGTSISVYHVKEEDVSHVGGVTTARFQTKRRTRV